MIAILKILQQTHKGIFSTFWDSLNAGVHSVYHVALVILGTLLIKRLGKVLDDRTVSGWVLFDEQLYGFENFNAEFIRYNSDIFLYFFEKGFDLIFVANFEKDRNGQTDDALVFVGKQVFYFLGGSQQVLSSWI